MTLDTTPVLLKRYRDVASRWDAALGNAKIANRLFDELHELFKQLRTTTQGREGITSLMDDASLGVRLSAAAHSLGWDTQRASKVLEEIANVPGLHAVTAEYTLKAFREGKLNQDW
jgi:Holliday junction resolvasome RuvABC DNA-binding subunit